jgi:lysozyme family protein
MDKSTRIRMSRKYPAQFIQALETTLLHEGGWSDHPNDRGGLTYMGITGATLSRYNKSLDMHELTPEIVADIYYELFWRHYKIEYFPFGLREFMFDWVVHSGSIAIKEAQKEAKVRVDGVMGPVTRDALARIEINRDNLRRSLAIRRMTRLCKLVRASPKQASFIVGWWNRVQKWL